MKNKIALLFIILFAVSCGYNPSDAEIINKLNNALNIEIAQHFKLIKSSSSVVSGDLVEEFEIEFNKSDYENLLKKINLKEWEKVEKGYQFEKSINEKSGVIVSISNNETKVRYQYGEI